MNDSKKLQSEGIIDWLKKQLPTSSTEQQNTKLRNYTNISVGTQSKELVSALHRLEIKFFSLGAQKIPIESELTTLKKELAILADSTIIDVIIQKMMKLYEDGTDFYSAKNYRGSGLEKQRLRTK